MATKVSDIDLVIDTNGLLRGFEWSEIIENSTIDNEIKQTGIVVYKM